MPVRPEGARIAPELRRNERIRAREVLVIGEDGERLGLLPLAEALEAARAKDLDLVEVAPGAVPPVCRILDYGKFIYDQQKKARNQNKQNRQQHHGELREVRFKVKIGDNDMALKLRRAEAFLREGNKVKLSVMFRGREIVHPEIGQGLLERARKHLEEVGVVDKSPTMEGRFMNMIMGPLAAKVRPKPERGEKPERQKRERESPERERPAATAAASEG